MKMKSVVPHSLSVKTMNLMRNKKTHQNIPFVVVNIRFWSLIVSPDSQYLPHIHGVCLQDREGCVHFGAVEYYVLCRKCSLEYGCVVGPELTSTFTAFLKS